MLDDAADVLGVLEVIQQVHGAVMRGKLISVPTGEHLIGAWAWDLSVRRSWTLHQMIEPMIGSDELCCAPLHALVWSAVIAANTIDGPQLWRLALDTLCVHFVNGRLADKILLRHCLHGFGHGVMLTSIHHLTWDVAADGETCATAGGCPGRSLERARLPRGACMPLAERSLPLGRRELAAATAICDAAPSNSAVLQHVCGIGMWMTFIEVSSGGIETKPSWAWPCDTAGRYAPACFTRLAADHLVSEDERPGLNAMRPDGQRTLGQLLSRCRTLGEPHARESCIFGIVEDVAKETFVAAEAVPGGEEDSSDSHAGGTSTSGDGLGIAPLVPLVAVCAAVMPSGALMDTLTPPASTTRGEREREWLACVGGTMFGIHFHDVLEELHLLGHTHDTPEDEADQISVQCAALRLAWKLDEPLAAEAAASCLDRGLPTLRTLVRGDTSMPS